MTHVLTKKTMRKKMKAYFYSIFLRIAIKRIDWETDIIDYFIMALFKRGQKIIIKMTNLSSKLDKVYFK